MSLLKEVAQENIVCIMVTLVVSKFETSWLKEVLAAVIESLHQAPTAVCSAAESAMVYALSVLMDPELPVNMLVVVAATGMSQQRVWSKAEAPLNILSKVVTLETARKWTYVCVYVCVGVSRRRKWKNQ